MPLPLKVLYYRQLQAKTTSPDVPKSGHNVLKMEFLDFQNQVKIGFFKELSVDGIGDGTYPELLAKYSVATSVLARLALGKKAAEDRFVFDDDGNIKGTISINIAKFKPLSSMNQSLPNDPQERELVCPSVETLLEYNVASLLVSACRIKCDDRHPANFSLFGLIDWDMAFYPYTYIMKGKRLVDGIKQKLPANAMKITARQLDNFPFMEGRTHTPTNSYPGNGNLLKRFRSYDQFQKLATNPALQTKDGNISWQEQFFAAFLKELITFDPIMLKERLKEYLGEDMPLNYLALPKGKSDQLEKNYPDLFNAKTDKEPFIQHIMTVFEREYQELYNAVVLYAGCKENQSKVSVVGFNRFLINKPSVYNKIITWTKKQNKKMQMSWDLYAEQINEASAKQRFLDKSERTRTKMSTFANNRFVKTDKSNYILDAFTTSHRARYDLSRMEQRYHQIWRDAHSGVIKEILHRNYSLIRELANTLRLKPKPLSMAVNDEIIEFNELEQLVASSKLLTESDSVDCNETNELKVGLKALEAFAYDLHTCTKEYYLIPLQSLSKEHNQAFCTAVSNLILQSETKVLKYLLGSSFAGKFGDGIKDLQQFYIGLNFQYHLVSKDRALTENITQDYTALLDRHHTDQEVVISCLEALFSWCNTLKKETFNDMILYTISAYQPPFYHLFAKRYRAPGVEVYLKTTTDSCANSLAAILSDGGTENTSLNTYLIKTLIPVMLEATHAQVEVNLLSVRNAIDHNIFQAEFYAKKAQEFVKKDKRFEIPISKKKVAQFTQVLFSWAQQQKSKYIRQLIITALEEYEPYSWNFISSRTRRKEILTYFKAAGPNNVRLLALILTNGENNINSFNTILLSHLLKAMKVYAEKVKVLKIADFNVIYDIIDEYLPYYGTQLKEYAKARTYDEPQSSACAQL